MAYTQGVRGDAITALGLGQLPVAGAVSEVQSLVNSIFGGDKAAAARTADLQSAYARGDAAYIIQWINDVPPHPNASNQLAKALLAKLQAGPSARVPPTVGTMAIGGGLGALTSNPLLLIGAGILAVMLLRR